MKYYELNVAGLKRQLTLCPVTDDLYIAGFIMIGDPELSRECAKELLKKVPEYDYILTAETKGIPLAHEMAELNGDSKYFVARKGRKLYMSGVFECKVQSISTANTQTLYLDTADAELMKGKRILIADDVVSTGESAYALQELVKMAGGELVGICTVLAEGEAAYRPAVIYLEKLPLFDKDGNIIG